MNISQLLLKSYTTANKAGVDIYKELLSDYEYEYLFNRDGSLRERLLFIEYSTEVNKITSILLNKEEMTFIDVLSLDIAIDRNNPYESLIDMTLLLNCNITTNITGAVYDFKLHNKKIYYVASELDIKPVLLS